MNTELVSAIASSIIKSGKRLAQELKQKNPTTPPLMYEWHGKKYLCIFFCILAGILFWRSS